jgi:hypothetical protein
MHRLLDNVTGITLIGSCQVGITPASTLVTTGTAVDLAGEGRKVALSLSIGQNSTGTNTVSIVISESADNSSWTTLYSFGDKSAVGLTGVDLTPTKRYIRAVATIRETAAAIMAINFALLGAVYNERGIPSNVA